MTVAGCQAVNIGIVKTFALQTLEQEGFIRIKMLGISGIHNVKLLHGIAHPGRIKLRRNIMLAAHHQRFTKPRALIHHRGAQHPRIIALGKDHPSLRDARALGYSAQNAGGWIHPGFQRQLITFHIDNRAPRGPGINTRFRHCRRYAINKPRIKRSWNDILPAKG